VSTAGEPDTPDEPAPNPAPTGSPDSAHCPLPTAHILYEDIYLLAVNKPAPLLTQAPPGVPSLEAMVKAYLKQKHAKPGGVYLGIPHRLDRPVSGVIVFARNTKATRRIHAQFQEHKVRKVYWALVEGEVTPDAGVWDDWVRKIAGEARTVTIELHADLTSYTGRSGRRQVDPGEVELWIGASSTDIRATLPLTMTGERREVGFDRVMQPAIEITATEDDGAAEFAVL